MAASDGGGDTKEESVIKEVELTVPKTDDPTMPCVTFRMWVLGLIACVILSIVNMFYYYRTNPLGIGSMAVVIVAVPIGHLMAKVLPTRVFFQDTKFEFTMNPGPFNIKEHVLISIFASAAASGVYATHLLTVVRIFYKRGLSFLPAFLVMLTSQVLGFGWAGIFRKFLVEPGEMWWPNLLVQVSLFRTLHEKEKRPTSGMTRSQLFVTVMICAFAYYVFPGYLITIISTISWVCWLAPKSVLFQQLGSGSNGLGLGSFGLDWSTISAYLGSPLSTPWFASANIAIGFFLGTYVMTPITYWFNAYKAKNFPLFSSNLFMANGEKYNVESIVNSKFQLDRNAYAKNGPVHLSTFFAMTYGLGFASLSSTLVHVLLFNGSELWRQTKSAFRGDQKIDIHTKLMKKYKSVPMWWFLVIIVGNIAAIIFATQYYNESLQLPWWGVFLACAISVFYTLPIGIIVATTNQGTALNIITEYIVGYLYPEHPVANMCFKVYGTISTGQALTFLQDFKLGLYMKIPPRSMFMAQVVGTLVSVFVYAGTAWWMMGAIPHICDTSMLPPDSPWTCPQDRVFYDASVIWGLVGPRRIFGDLGEYGNVNWFFLAGAVAPLFVWIAHKIFPSKNWIRNIHVPVIIGATAGMPPAAPVNYISWLIVAFLSGFVVFRYRPEWWKRYNYIFSAGLEAGTAFMSVLLFLAVGSIGIDWWGNSGEGCPLASCPTAKGIMIDGCPVVA